MTTEEQNDEAAAQYAEECARNAAHRALCIRESKTLRDEFARAALTGLLVRSTVFTDERGRVTLADLAYKIADAMLAERAK